MKIIQRIVIPIKYQGHIEPWNQLYRLKSLDQSMHLHRLENVLLVYSLKSMRCLLAIYKLRC